MIEYSGPEMQLVCDATSTRYRRTYDRDEFFTMLADAKEDGWRVALERGQWRHYSPESQSAREEFALLPEID